MTRLSSTSVARSNARASAPGSEQKMPLVIMLVRCCRRDGGQRFRAGLQDFVEISHYHKLSEHDFPVFGIGAYVIIIPYDFWRRQLQSFFLAGLDQFG